MYVTSDKVVMDSIVVEKVATGKQAGLEHKAAPDYMAHKASRPVLVKDKVAVGQMKQHAQHCVDG